MIYNNGLMLLATRLALCTLAMQSIAHPMCVIWKTTHRSVKKHLSYTWIISSAMLYRWPKKGGSFEPPRTPPVYGPVVYACGGLTAVLYSGRVCMWREGLTAVLCSDSVCMWREGLTAVLYSGSVCMWREG